MAGSKLSKTITIDIDKLDRNLTNSRITSISECTINTTAQPVNEENIVIVRYEQINEPENKELKCKSTNQWTRKWGTCY